jgi:uncharacterized protein YndB with AHSA1/START domain
MSATPEAAPIAERELVLTRVIDAPRKKLFRTWTEPELLKQWFAPLPYTTPAAELDVRPGGSSLVVMRGPDGQDMPMRGVYLDVVPNERLVFTDAFTKAWEPTEKAFMTAIVTFEDLGGGRTRYTARAALDGRRPRGAREDGLPRGLGPVRRPARRPGCEALIVVVPSDAGRRRPACPGLRRMGGGPQAGQAPRPSVSARL